MTSLAERVTQRLQERGHRLYHRSRWITRHGWMVQPYYMDGDDREAVAVLTSSRRLFRAERERQLVAVCDDLVHCGQTFLIGRHYRDRGLVSCIVVRRQSDGWLDSQAADRPAAQAAAGSSATPPW